MLNGSLFVLSSKRVSGIYTITNIQNGKVYVGESLDIYRRWHEEHLPSLRNKSHHNSYLQSDFNTYGEDNFRFEVLHRYSDDSTIITKAKLLILESYYMKTFTKSGIELYNAENSLIEILHGRKIPEEGTVLIMNIVRILSEYTPKLCDGVVYFGERNTFETILLEYTTVKPRNKRETVREFKEYLEKNKILEKEVCETYKLKYVLKGEERISEFTTIKDKYVKEIVSQAIQFEQRNKKQKTQNTIQTTSNSKYEPIKENEVRFSVLFSKTFVENGMLPQDNDYGKIRNYLVNNNIIEVKYVTLQNGISSGITFATEYSLNNDILRVVGENRRGDNVVPSLAFTENGIKTMMRMFGEIENEKRFKMFCKDVA